MAGPADTGALVEAGGLGKSFGAVRALKNASLVLRRGESVGIVGHNGAGKSTLINILCGTLAPDAGNLQVHGTPVAPRWDVREARRLGIRCVFQELSLCANLSLAENMHIAQPAHGVRRWRERAGRSLTATLDEIFPGHGLKAADVAGDLPIGKRQAVEIARAFTAGDAPLDVMILDEPTSSLDGTAARQLLAYIRRFVAGGKTCVLITHKLREIFEVTDRVMVMRDGAVVSTSLTAETDWNRLVAAMGQDEAPSDGSAGVSAAPARAGRPHGPAADVVVQGRGACASLQVRCGEIVGLAGLAGHGQTRLLLQLHDAAGVHGKGANAEVDVSERVAFVAGDRLADGVFPLWSIQRNMSLACLARLRRRMLIDLAAERAEAERWGGRLALLTPDVALPILSLSGGNQQKVLFARALASAAPLILMDDPMRGVDVGTKREVYELIAAEARGGRSFVWYTTEFDELFHCDRIYVFSAGRIAGEIARGELSEERVLSLSFAEAT